VFAELVRRMQRAKQWMEGRLDAALEEHDVVARLRRKELERKLREDGYIEITRSKREPW